MKEKTMRGKLIRSGRESNILEIHDANSTINSYYDMSAPIQFTLSYCSGLSEDDFYNVLSVSPGKDYFYSSYIASDFHEFNSRAPHQHAFFELVLVLEGSITQRMENKDYLYPAGTCCLINQNVFHVEKYIGKARVLFIGLSVDFIRELQESHRTAYYKEETALDNSVLRFMTDNIELEKGKNYLDFLPVYQNRKNTAILHKFADRLLQTMMFPTFGSTFVLKGLICQLFYYLDTKEYYHISNVTLNSSSDLLLFSRIGHLMEDTDGRMSRSDLEKSLCYSGNYINAIVNKYTGMCLYDYGLTFTMKKAAHLLAETKNSISAIEAQLGLTNRTHFYKLFRKKYGMTPGEYRKEMQKPDAAGRPSADYHAV